MRKSLAVAAVAALVLAGGIAYAAVQDGGATVHACALKQNGQLRLDTGGGCLPSEQSVEWGQVGPPGPPGNTDSTVRFASGFIADGATASSAVLSATGRLGTLSFTCSDLTYAAAADTNPFPDHVNFYSPEVADSPFQVLDHLRVPWPAADNRWFQLLIEGIAGSENVTLTTITGFVRSFPEFFGCSYYAHMSTAEVRSPQTITP
jgi:hypothetical protein